MPFNAFVGGVQPGGLTNELEVKILICYLLDNMEQPLSFDQLNEILQSTGLVNYFEFAEALSDLLKSGHLRQEQDNEGQEVYAITEVGSVMSQTLKKTLPLGVREKTIETARHLAEVHKCMDEVEIHYQPAPDGYILQMVMKDIGSDLLDMKVFLPTEEECIQVKERIENDPATLYANILALLIQG